MSVLDILPKLIVFSFGESCFVRFMSIIEHFASEINAIFFVDWVQSSHFQAWSQ